MTAVVKAREKARRLGVLPMFMAALVAALVGSAVWITVASAGVHDNSAFELDANTADGAAAGTDWEIICKEFNEGGTGGSGPACQAAAGGASGAVRKLFITDDKLNTGSSDDQPGTGATKDTNDISGWDCKLANISPPKNDMLHAGAAVYNVAGKQVIYFFLDRKNSDNGNANVGFWFMRGQKGCPAVANGPTVNFTGGPHAKGDVLVTSAFTGGGGVSEILVFAWCSDPGTPDLKCGNSGTPGTVGSIAAGSGDGPLQLIAKGADCRPVPAAPVNPAVCATVNRGGEAATKTTPPIPADPAVDPLWPYVGAGNPSNVYEPGALFEGGINTSDLGLNIGCGGTFLADTRSSQSPTAQLHDFSLGSLTFCEASMTTAPSVTTEVSPGTSVTDTATVTGTGTGSPPTPTGSVTFFLCAPSELSPQNTGTCPAGAGTQVGNPVALGGSGAIATATSSAVAPTTPGKYCFRATWPGDSNYAGPLSETNSASECFTVRQIPTTTVTGPSSSSTGLPAQASAVALGTLLYDRAVVSASQAGGGAVTGTVTFFVCAPSELTAGACAAGTGTQVGSAVALVASNPATTPPSAVAVSSPGVNANVAGTWCFRATYTPSGSTYTGSSDVGQTTECVTVNKVNTTTVTTPSTTGIVAVNTSVTDTAVVTAATSGDGTPTGTIDFFVCSPSQLTPPNTGTCAAGTGSAAGSKTAAAVGGSNPPASTATSDAVIANVAGKWCFRAVYTPGGANGGNYNGSSEAGTATECFSVRDSTSATSVQRWLPNDKATITSAGGSPLNGTVTFTLHNSADCTGAAIAGATKVHTLTDAASGLEYSTDNTTVFVTSPGGSYSWKTVFAPANPTLVTGTTKCETTSLTINDNP